MFKKILSLSACLALAFALVACHANDDNDHHNKKQVSANCHRGVGGGVYCNSR